jgi:hypothetical protein
MLPKKWRIFWIQFDHKWRNMVITDAKIRIAKAKDNLYKLNDKRKPRGTNLIWGNKSSWLTTWCVVSDDAGQFNVFDLPCAGSMHSDWSLAHSCCDVGQIGFHALHATFSPSLDDKHEDDLFALLVITKPPLLVVRSSKKRALHLRYG